MGQGWVWGWAALVLWGCAGGQHVRRGPLHDSVERSVDSARGFALTRPEGDWELELRDEVRSDGLSIPVVVRHPHGAQVVVQLAPALAEPEEYAQGLAEGLKGRAGVKVSRVEPHPNGKGIGFA